MVDLCSRAAEEEDNSALALEDLARMLLADETFDDGYGNSLVPSSPSDNGESSGSATVQTEASGEWDLSKLRRSKLIRIISPEVCGSGDGIGCCDVAVICTLSPLRDDLVGSIMTLEFALQMREVGLRRSLQHRRLSEEASQSSPPCSEEEEDVRVGTQASVSPASIPIPVLIGPRSLLAPAEVGARVGPDGSSGGTATVAVRSAEDYEAEIRGLKAQVLGAQELAWRLRRAEEEAVAHQEENDELRRRLAEAMRRNSSSAAIAVAAALASESILEGDERRQGIDGQLSAEPAAVMPPRTDLQVEPPPPMCETDWSASSKNASAASPYGAGVEAVVPVVPGGSGGLTKSQNEKEASSELKKLTVAVQKLEAMIFVIESKGRFVPPVVSFPLSDRATDKMSVDRSSGTMTGKGGRNSAENDDDSGSCFKPAGGMKDLMASSLSVSVSSSSSVVSDDGGSSVSSGVSWIPAGAIGALFDAPSVTSSSLASSGGGNGGGAISISTGGSWSAAGATRHIMGSCSSSVISGGTSSGASSIAGGGGSYATDGSWSATGATRAILDWPSAVSSAGGGGSSRRGGDWNGVNAGWSSDSTMTTEAADTASVGNSGGSSWMAAGGTGTLLDDDGWSSASSSTWDTNRSSSWLRGGVHQGGSRQERESDNDGCKPVGTGLADDAGLSRPHGLSGDNDGPSAALLSELHRVQGLLRSVLESKDGREKK